MRSVDPTTKPSVVWSFPASGYSDYGNSKDQNTYTSQDASNTDSASATYGNAADKHASTASKVQATSDRGSSVQPVDQSLRAVDLRSLDLCLMQTKKTAVRNVLAAVFVLYCCSQMVLRAELWSVLLDGPSEIVPAFELV